jgi:hypothetical protein
VATLDCHREALGDQLTGDLGVEHPPVEVNQQRLGPAVVQPTKGLRVPREV